MTPEQPDKLGPTIRGYGGREAVPSDDQSHEHINKRYSVHFVAGFQYDALAEPVGDDKKVATAVTWR